jgi:hypothetical protein
LRDLNFEACARKLAMALSSDPGRFRVMSATLSKMDPDGGMFLCTRIDVAAEKQAKHPCFCTPLKKARYVNNGCEGPQPSTTIDQRCSKLATLPLKVWRATLRRSRGSRWLLSADTQDLAVKKRIWR